MKKIIVIFSIFFLISIFTPIVSAYDYWDDYYDLEEEIEQQTNKFMAWEIISTIIIFLVIGVVIFVVYSSYNKEHGEKIQNNVAKIQDLELKKMEQSLHNTQDQSNRGEGYRPKFCTSCGTKIKEGEKFCVECGKKV